MLAQIGIHRGMLVEQLGETLLEKGFPQTPFLNLLMTFQQREAKLPSLKSVREFRKRV